MHYSCGSWFIVTNYFKMKNEYFVVVVRNDDFNIKIKIKCKFHAIKKIKNSLNA